MEFSGDYLQSYFKNSEKNRLKEWLSTLAEIIDYEITNMEITSSVETAFCSCFNHIHTITTDRNKLDMWWRETTCYSKSGENIRIKHTHSSLPFDAKNGMALINLKPDSEKHKIQEKEQQKSPAELAKSLYRAFQNQERNVLENLFSEDFTFTSPDDKNLDKKQFFEISFPFSEKVKSFEFLKVVENGNDVFVIYRCSAEDLPDFENTELLTIMDGKVRSVRVFYGDK